MKTQRFLKSAIVLGFLGAVLLGTGYFSPQTALAADNMVVTVLVASNEGNDFDLDNDAFRDRLIQLFSYTSYKQVDQVAVDLKAATRQTVTLPDGYQMQIDLQKQEGSRYFVRAVVEKSGTAHVDTVLAIEKGSAAFVGGPPVGKGSLIIVMEIGF